MIKLNRTQYRIWLDSIIHESQNVYNLSSSARIVGELNCSILKRSLNYYFDEFSFLHSLITLDNEGYPCWEVKTPYTLPYYEIQLPDNITIDKIKETIWKKASEPISLKEDFPCKFYLFKLSKKEFIFLEIFHHCVMDAYGMQKFSERLAQIYNCLYNGQKISLAAIPSITETNDFIDSHLKRSALRNEGVQKICRILNNVPFSTSLPFSSNGGAIRSKDYSFSIGKDLILQCKTFCAHNKQTMFRVFCAAWGIVIGRMLNKDKIILDHAINIRSDEFKNVAGTMVNNMPLLIDLSDKVTSMQLLESIREERHLIREYPFIDYIDLIAELRKKNADLYSSTPNLMINYPVSSKMSVLDIEGCKSEYFYRPIMDLVETIGLHIYDDEESTCQIMYKDFIPSYFIQELAHSFCFVLQQIIKQDKPIYNLQLVTPERMQFIIQQNEVKPFLIHKTLIQQLKQHRDRLANKKAIICQSNSLTYTEFDELTDKICRFVLRFKTNKFRVAICLKRNIYTIPTIIGVLKAGATYVPFDNETPLSRMEFMLKDSEATLFLTEKDIDIPSVHCPIIYISDIINEIADSTPVIADLPHTAYIIYTSGTTGLPKATPISTTSLHQLIHNIIHHNKWIDEHDCVLQMASISFDASIVDIFVALYSGATLVMADDNERKDIGLLLNLLIKEQVSFATIPPAVMAILPDSNLPAMKTMVFAGEATQKEVFNRWLNKGIRIVNAYGPTENSVCSTFADITETSSSTNIGKPLTNVSCYVLDKNLNLLPYGVEGELYLGGNQLTDGYLNQVDLNSKRFVKNPYATIEQTENNVNQLIYKTGDVVYLKPDFNIEYIGRTDFQIKLNGHRIELEEIERRLIMHPDINQAVTTLVTLPNGQKQIVAYIKLQSETKSIPPKELHEFMAKSLPIYMIPTKWVFVEEFKLTTNGKIDRSSPSKESDVTISDYTLDYIAPATASEHILVGIFSKLLGIDNISVKANLFEEYGVESIQAMSAIYEAKRQGIELSVSTLYKNKSIRASLRDNKTYPYYWYNEYSDNKPIIILICGLVYLQPYHQDLLELLKDKYTVLVLDSIHEYFFMKKDCSFASLLERYTKVLSKMLKGKKLLGITGWCIGGEIALQLAVELKQLGIASPIVFSLDGYLHHEVDKNAPLFYMNFPNVPEEINKERDRIKNEFIESIFFRPYNGKVYCFLADQFSKYPPNGEILTNEEVDFNYKNFKKNPEDWERLQPGCIRIFIHDNHYSFLQKKNMIEVVKIMDKEREIFLETS